MPDKPGGATLRLTLSYLTIIMALSIGFSIVFYNASSRELGRQLPPSSLFNDSGSGSNSGLSGNNNSGSGRVERDPRIDDFLAERIAEGRRALTQRLVMLNVIALIGGSALSWGLARRTLRPIEANIEAQVQFVSDASHELRTPLTALQTVNEVALRRNTLTAKQARDVMSHTIAEVIKLKTLTDSLLKLATDNGNPAAASLVSLQETAAEAMNRVVSLAQPKQISVEDSIGRQRVLANQLDVVQILVILLENAIKYSPSKSTVYLSSSVKGHSGYLHVRDEGPGIRPFDQRRIFERFYRADQSRSRQLVEGHGIGLSLARKLALQYGGDITVSSAVGTGSTFTLRLPLA